MFSRKEWFPYEKDPITVRRRLVAYIGFFLVPIVLDVAPLIKNDRTLVPLRAVAEAFSAHVEWVGETRTVLITAKYPKNKNTGGESFDARHIRTSNGGYEYLDLTLSANVLMITGQTIGG